MAFRKVILRGIFADITEANKKTNNQKLFIGSLSSIEI